MYYFLAGTAILSNTCAELDSLKKMTFEDVFLSYNKSI